jgi:hypothetical protein
MRIPSSYAVRSLFVPLPALATALALAACGGSSPSPPMKGPGAATTTGQSSFSSAPPANASPPGGSGAGFASNGAAGPSAGLAAGAPGGASVPAATTAGGASASGAGTATPARTVQETDLYALDSTTNRLFYLNSYRGLMVFDLTNVDQPKLLGRSPIFGTPVQMFVQNGIAVVVVADWYGMLDDGTPFHGSIVRGLDATDPTNIKVLGEAKLGGLVQDTRIVGNVLYAVSEDYGWVYGWDYAWGGVGGGVSVGVGVAAPVGGPAIPGYAGATMPNVIVSSVNFANGQITAASTPKTYPGYGGVFNVTQNAIMLAHPVAAAQPNLPAPAKTALQYLDITDPAGAIVERGSIEVDGSITAWGADNGRWNLDFADGQTAHVIGCAGGDCGSGYVLATVDFSNPDQPTTDSELNIASTAWSATARFDTGRMYLSPSGVYSPNGDTTPLEIFDLTNPLAPKLAGQTQIPGSVWLMIPSGNQLFALGQDDTTSASQVSLKYLDVSNAASPTLLGTSTFGDGWTSTPATDTFKAFTMDPTQGLVVLPFSGWDYSAQAYHNGVQLIDFTATSLTTDGYASSKGWVERGIFANGRIVSLSDLALSVVDYSDRLAPTVTAELTLARNVIAAQPAGSTIAEISGDDFLGNDLTHSDVRVLPISDAQEIADESQAPDVSVPGVGARVFTNGTLVYVVTTAQVVIPCPTGSGGVGGYAPGGPALPVPAQPAQCTAYQEQVQVVDVSNGGATARGSVALPIDPNGYYPEWGWGGFYYYDWYEGSEIAQVNGSILAFRRWDPIYNPNGRYVDESSDLFIVDLSNPDSPGVASAVITDDPNGWWGNMQVVGDTLYTTHYVWPAQYVPNATVRYYLDAIDLTDPMNPKIQQSINVPGVLVGGSTSDPTILYTIDYQWNSGLSGTVNNFDAIKLSGGVAVLQSSTPLDGWVGSVIVRGNTAYTSTQKYVYVSNQPGIELHQIDLTNPAQPVDSVASGPAGWGWLVDVQGDRMLVTSGWGLTGLDVYQLVPNAPPAYSQFVRTEGWSISSIARQNNQLFLSGGEWGVQAVTLQ